MPTVERLRQEVEQAPSADALYQAAHRTLSTAAPGERETVRRTVALHGQHWNRRLSEYRAALPPCSEMLANPSLFMGGSLDEAVACVSHMDGISGCTATFDSYHEIVIYKNGGAAAPYGPYTLKIERVP